VAKGVIPPEPKPEPAPARSAEADPLEAYLLQAINAWAPPRVMPDKDGSHYVAIARDIVEVVLDPAEAPIWDERWKSATLLAGIAFFESHFWKHVDDGRCNDNAWREGEGKKLTLVTGNCDGGWATSMWQIHAYDGIALTEDGGWIGAWGAKGRKLLYGKDLIADRRVAARVALHIARASLKRSGTLCGYSGENDGCPKARVRLEFAKAWMRSHPFHK
jgi:hypothetical protein